VFREGSLERSWWSLWQLAVCKPHPALRRTEGAEQRLGSWVARGNALAGLVPLCVTAVRLRTDGPWSVSMLQACHALACCVCLHV
jgi:hypothetical protein